MATGNKRDVRLAVEIDTVGEESLRRAGDELKRLAKEGGAAAPELAALAAQFDKLANQSGALATFRQLGTEVDKLKVAQTEAAAAAGTLGDRLAAAQAEAKPFVDRQRELTESTLAARKANADLAVGLRELDAQFKTNRITQAGYDEALAASKKTRAENVALIASNTLELAKQRPALESATAAEAKLQRQYEAQQAEITKANEALRQRERALKGASEAALAAGAATTDLAASEADLLRTTQETVGATRRLADEQDKAAIAARLADLEFAKNVTTLRELDAAARALGEADGAAAMQKLEQGAREADAQFDKLVASLRAAETAAEEYAVATARAAGASRDDTQALQARQVAAQRLLDVDRALTAEQRELIAVRNTGRAAILAEAQAMLKLAADARASLAASEAAVQGARRAGAALESAFGATGVRSIDAIEQEIKQTSVALERLQKEAREGGIGLDDLTRAAGAAEVKIARLRAEILQVQSAPGTFGRLSAGLNDLVTRFGALSAVIAAVGVAARPVIAATVALEQMRRVLTTVTGSSEVAEAQITKLRLTAQQAGVSFTEVGQSYAKFAASALQSGLTLEQVNSAFDSVALAAGNLGLSSDQAKRALEALSQIASKGTVSMEELRQQLGDALPGVLPLLAKELGLTQRELLKVVESGGLLASEGIPAIDRALRQLGPAGGQVEGLVASFNRFKNVVLQAGTALVDGPFGQAVGTVLAGLAGAFRDVAVVAVFASEGLRRIIETLQVTAAAFVTGTLSTQLYKDELNRLAGESGARLKSFTDTAYGAADGAAALAAKVGLTGESFAKLTLEQQKSIEAAALAAQSAEKNVQAAKAQADALIRTVGLMGDEAAAREASLTAARLVLKATEDQLTADRALLASFELQKAVTLEQVRLGKQTIENVKVLIEETDKRIEKATVDVVKTLAQADAARAFALAQELVVKSAGDQSESLDELRKSVEAAASAQILASRRYAEGKGSLDSLKTATDALALAKGLLRDALNDQDEATKRTIASLKAAADVTKAEIALEITKLEIKKQNLILEGRTTDAARLDLDIRRLQLTATRSGTEAKIAEAKALQELILRQFAEAEARGTLTPALRQELNTRYEQQRAVILQTEASKLNEAQELRNIKAVEDGKTARNAQTGATGGATAATDGNSRATDTNTTSTRTNTDAKNNNAKAVGLLAIEQEKYASALEEARKAAGIEGSQYGPGSGSTVGLGPAGIKGPAKSFGGTPFVSGSTGGGSYSTGQAANKPPGEWTYVISGFDVPGADASGKRLPGGWKAVQGPRAVAGNAPSLATFGSSGSGYNVRDPFGSRNSTATPVTQAVAAAYAAGATTAQLHGLNSAEEINLFTARLTQARAGAPTSSTATPVFDNDTPGTTGQYVKVPILGKYEVSLRNDRTGVTTSSFTDTAEQAQAFIDNLQQAFRTANGG